MLKINGKRIFFISDTHFGVKNNSEEWIEIQKDYFFNWFIPLIKKNYKPGDILFHLGDVFDSRQSLNLKVLNLGINIFEELSKIFVDGIYIICGNHDIFGKTNNEINSLISLKWIPNIKIFIEPETVMISNKKFFVMPWQKDHTTEKELLNNIEMHDYLLCHTDIKGMMFNKHTIIEEGLLYENLINFKKIYSGHIHYSQESGKIKILGCPYQLTRSDSNNKKGITLLDLETEKEEFFENDYSPKFIKIPFEEILNSTPEELNKIFKNNFIDITIEQELATKTPLSLLTDYVISPLKLTFIPIIKNNNNNIINDIIYNIDNKNFSLLNITRLYLENTSYDKETKDKIFKIIKKLSEKVMSLQE